MPWRTIREALDIARQRGVDIEVRGEKAGWPVIVVNGRPILSPFDDLDAELSQVSIGFLSAYLGIPATDLGGDPES